MIVDLHTSELDASRWGQKTARLSSLARAGFCVPPGFAVATSRSTADQVLLEVDAWLTVNPPTHVVVRTSSLDEDGLGTAGAGVSASTVGLPATTEAVVSELRRLLAKPPHGAGSVLANP